MKKFALMVLVAVLFAGCIEEECVTVDTYNYTIEPYQWKERSDDLGVYLYCQIPERYITYDVFREGMLVGYFRYELNGVEVLYPLPFDDFYQEKNGYRYTTQVTCEFSPGYVTFILKHNDLLLDRPNYDYDFQVKVMW